MVNDRANEDLSVLVQSRNASITSAEVDTGAGQLDNLANVALVAVLRWRLMLAYMVSVSTDCRNLGSIDLWFTIGSIRCLPWH